LTEEYLSIIESAGEASSRPGSNATVPPPM
jgi:hypothetical protein